MTNSNCYKKGLDKNSTSYWEKHKNKVGIVVHSTGANNTTIKRYVQPSEDDPKRDEIIADIGKNAYGNDWNHSSRQAGVHAFIGTNAKGVIETYEVLPYEFASWGVGRGKKGSYNYAPTAHIQFEICEDNLKSADYFNKAFKEAIEYCAYLCKKFGWDANVICSHKESVDRGYGEGHGDPDHWLKKFGKNMNWFREEVQKMLDAGKEDKTEENTDVLYRVQVGAFHNKAYAEAYLKKVQDAGFPDAFIVTVGAEKTATVTAPKLKVGDKVKMAKDATVYGKTTKFADWVYDTPLFVREIDSNRIVVSTQATGAITGSVHSKYLTKI